MTYSGAKGIVDFGGFVWWVFIRFCRTKLSDEQKAEKHARNFICFLVVCYLITYMIIKLTSPEPLYVVNGVVVNKTEFEKYKSNDIQSTTRFEGEAAKVIYGEQGKNGVILITLKHN